MRHAQQRLAEQRQRGIRAVVPLELGVTDGGTDPDVLVGDGHGVQPGHPVDVDQVGGLGQPHVEHGDEALTPGEDLAVVPHLGEGRDGLVEGSW